MKNDFKPVVGHHFNLRGDWGGVLDCEVLAIEPNKALSYTWNFKHADAAFDLQSVVTFTLTPTRTGRCCAWSSRASGRIRSRLLAAPRSDGSSSSGSWRRFWRGRTKICRVALPSFQIKGGLIELEYVYSANPPLAVHCLYGGRHRQRHRHDAGETGRLGGPAGAVPADLAAAHAVCTCSRCPMPPNGAAREASADRSERHGRQDVREVGEGRKERPPQSPPSSQAAILRSRRATATLPCRPTSRPCRAGNATSGAISTPSSRAPSPACARP